MIKILAILVSLLILKYSPERAEHMDQSMKTFLCRALSGLMVLLYSTQGVAQG
ncbi:MAG: hypothetical protein PF904_14430 [Kiritimatiellae bacterium]|jgi:hypothetical protein|nr:hypothetical protein [Kiritimatiellia bacterium]